ncbi:sulfotransferase family protein [Mycolicibacterium holsaticum]|uniref:sulfotransferase family protein n=1 Tax=Mycolicibacterium holsaticum TaxID=152142 RepID=UPI001C7CDABE|nr:sulfotransferase [Mycolicibacterium holsaticum]MDA4108022.1 sulfotransferase [Mycolicibacterium holsaticum DSM 44478 = JCM 12374]QZA14558.1 sulfotransferase [Mycolicibacterium holsaticum DSM 44478 = JCM 12374]UNC07996.1 sulfotransferase [Mycolicibacterium holsaticum DSM 44478 = JCM 12374]
MTAKRYPSPQRLLDEAVAECGHTDFGPGDFREGLAVLLDSLERDGDLDPGTDTAVIGDLHRRLVNRLEVEAHYRAHPEVDDVVVEGPVDINGLPRTGTTALADMLSLDPQFRCLRGWEQYQPVPPPIAGAETADPRRQAFLRMHEERPVAQAAMHIFEVDATMEDTEILGMAFHGQQMTLPVPSYRTWWRRADLTDTYAYHRRVVKLLGSRCPPRRWLFKAPHHKFHLSALAEAYPDVRFVMTHRDPAKVVPSYTSLVSTIFPPAHGERDLHALGREVSVHLREGMESAIADRARIGEDRFFDVHHTELAADPRGTVERVYDWLGLELKPDVAEEIFAWQDANAVGAKGTHRYTAEQFGLSVEQIRSDYDFYIRRFDVAAETAGG